MWSRILTQLTVFLMSLAIFGVFLVGCSRTSSTDSEAEESATEIVSANISGIANATESNGSHVALRAPVGNLLEQIFQSFADPIPSAFAAEECPDLRTASCDADGNIELTYANCTRHRTVWNGSERFAFSSLAVCNARLTAKAVPTSGSVLRTFGEGAATTVTIGNRQVSLDTSEASGYDNPVSGGVSVAFSANGDGDPVRTIDIRGIHQSGKNVRRDKEVWNVTVSTDVAKPLKIVGSGKDKEISEGRTVIQHNLAKYTAEADIVIPLTFAAGCCHPVAGAVETTFSGSKSGTQTLTFSSTCGVGTLKASDGSETSVQLQSCF